MPALGQRQRDAGVGGRLVPGLLLGQGKGDEHVGRGEHPNKNTCRRMRMCRQKREIGCVTKSRVRLDADVRART